MQTLSETNGGSKQDCSRSPEKIYATYGAAINGAYELLQCQDGELLGSDGLVSTLAGLSVALSKRQDRNGVAEVLDAALRSGRLACAGFGRNANASQ
jgi:hypothetical protein